MFCFFFEIEGLKSPFQCSSVPEIFSQDMPQKNYFRTMDIDEQLGNKRNES